MNQPTDVSCFFLYGLYSFGQIVFKNGIVSPYVVRLPLNAPRELFRSLAVVVRDTNLLPRVKRPHYVGIANSGIVLSQEIYEQAKALDREAKISIIFPRLQEQQIGSFTETDYCILVDNAVTTGETLRKVQNLLEGVGCSPKTVIRIFDREDVGLDRLSTSQRIKRDLGLDVISIFRLRDIFPLINLSERRLIIAYQKKYGTKSFRDWIGG